jgi:hypothetical protein
MLSCGSPTCGIQTRLWRPRHVGHFCRHYLVGVLIQLVTALTQAAVRKALADEEATQLRRQDAPMVHKDVSPSVLINTGMDLEEQQYEIDNLCIK